MRKDWLFIITGLPLVAWFVSSPTVLSQAGFFQWRSEGISATGLIAFALCSACMVLATRWGWLERRLGGLDSIYMVHKTLGIAAGLLIFGHWMLEQVPRWLVQAGLLIKPARQAMQHIPTWQDALRHPASDIGLYLGYVALALILVALIRLVPYHWFRRLHKAFPIAYLAMVFHSIVLLPMALWHTPAGLILMISAVSGTFASFVILLGRVGRIRRHTGEVVSVRALGLDTVEVDCLIAGRGLKHKAGQFVLAQFEGSRDPHPFTIASGSHDPRQLKLCIKALGDDTSAFVNALTVGSVVNLEGPYGQFDFGRSQGGDQVWIGAGIGITPFMARLETLAAQPMLPRPARMFFCAPQDHPLAQRARDLCQKAGVEFKLVDATRDGPLELHHALKVGDNHRRASMWFCGPARFGDALERAWRTAGLHPSRFHREHFAFR